MLSCALSKPWAVQGISEKEQAHRLFASCGQNRSTKRRSNPALCATMRLSPANWAAATKSIVLPATISDVMPVSLVTSAGIGFCGWRSEEHTSELQSLMRNSYADFCLKKKTH